MAISHVFLEFWYQIVSVLDFQLDAKNESNIFTYFESAEPHMNTAHFFIIRVLSVKQKWMKIIPYWLKSFFANFFSFLFGAKIQTLKNHGSRLGFAC